MSFGENLYANCHSCVTGSLTLLANQDVPHSQVHKVNFRYPRVMTVALWLQVRTIWQYKQSLTKLFSPKDTLSLKKWKCCPFVSLLLSFRVLIRRLWNKFDFSHILVSSSMQRFWATDGNRKCAVFLFTLSSHHHIYIVQFLFTSRDHLFENVGKTTVLVGEMFTSGCRPWLKNVACLSSLFLIKTFFINLT